MNREGATSEAIRIIVDRDVQGESPRNSQAVIGEIFSQSNDQVVAVRTPDRKNSANQSGSETESEIELDVLIKRDADLGRLIQVLSGIPGVRLPDTYSLR